MEEKNDYTDAASDNRNGQEIEVGIAGAGDRILAALLNQLFTFLVLLVPFAGLIAFAIKNEGRIGSGEEIFGLLLGMTSFWVGLAGILAYTVIQIYYMSRDGQSLGKKIMRIRVLKTDGRNPGFVGTVLVREIAWSVLVAIIAAVIGLAVGDNGENAINLLAFLANFVLLFGSGEEIFGLLLGMTSFWVGLAGILAYTVIQIYYMSRDGQSLGKKIMRIRVLKTDGRNPGFVGTVLVREIAWSVLVAIIAAVIGLAVGDNGENAINLLAFLANFVLLFMVKRDRRTLYDILADTVVVKLPK